MNHRDIAVCGDPGHPPSVHYHTRDGAGRWRDGSFEYDPSVHFETPFSMTGRRDPVTVADVERTITTRREAVLDIIRAEMSRTEDNHAATEAPDLMTYLDDIARHLLTIVEKP